MAANVGAFIDDVRPFEFGGGGGVNRELVHIEYDDLDKKTLTAGRTAPTGCLVLTTNERLVKNTASDPSARADATRGRLVYCAVRQTPEARDNPELMRAFEGGDGVARDLPDLVP